MVVFVLHYCGGGSGCWHSFLHLSAMEDCFFYWDQVTPCGTSFFDSFERVSLFLRRRQYSHQLRHFPFLFSVSLHCVYYFLVITHSYLCIGLKMPSNLHIMLYMYCWVQWLLVIISLIHSLSVSAVCIAKF